jgi:teichuronic acid biosynthesis protein TuaE
MIRNRKVYLPLNLVQNQQKLLTVLLTILLGLLVGLLVVNLNFSLLNLSLGAGVVLIFLWFLQYKQISIFFIEKIFCYLVFITGFFGVALFSINIGPFTLFPYRIFLLFLWFIFGLHTLVKGKIVFSQSKIKWFIVLLFIWLGYALVSSAWSISKEDAIRNIVFLFTGVSVIFFSTHYFRKKKELQILYNLWLYIFGFLIVIGFWEYLTGYHLPISGFFGETRTRFMFMPTGVFYNTNDYATFLALSIPFGIGIIRYGHKKYLRFSGLLCIISSFYLIVAAGSRANIIAVLFELTFILLFLLNFKRKIKSVIIIGVCAILLLIFLPSPVQEFFSQIGRELNSVVSETEQVTGSVSVRMNLVRNGLSFLYSTAGFGVGAGNAEYYMAYFAKYNTFGITNSHNWWLEILINYGIFIFIGYVIFYIGIIRNLWKIYRKKQTRGEKMICEALLVSLIGFFFASVSSSSIMAFNPQWLLFAFALSYINYFHRKSEKEEI